jgi:hypothetical protein
LEKELIRRGKTTNRTAVFAAVSERNMATKEYEQGARRRVLNNLTIEQVTDVVGLLGIRRVLRPAFRPFLEYFVWNGALGVVLQPEVRPPPR